MNMQDHIIAALREMFDRWEALLAELDDAQLVEPLQPSELPVKDVLAHLWAWQQRSIARLEAAKASRDPIFPDWSQPIPTGEDDDVDDVNAWIYQTYRDHSWSAVHSMWREGFQQFLELGRAVSEIELLDSTRYPWMEGCPLAFVLLASYDHHQEHYDALIHLLRRSA